jgi:hypothetical protein
MPVLRTFKQVDLRDQATACAGIGVAEGRD